MSLVELQPACLICRGGKNGALVTQPNVPCGRRLNPIHVINGIFVSISAWPCALVC